MRRSRRKISWSVSTRRPPARPASRGRDDEAAIEHADRQRRGRRTALVAAEQLVESLGLAFIVAKNDRRRAVAHETAELFDVTIDRFGRAQRKNDVRLVFALASTAAIVPSFRSAAQRALRRFEQLVAAWNVVAATARQLDVVLRVVPRPAQLRLDMRATRNDENRIRRKERENRSSLELTRVVAHIAVHRKHERIVDDPLRPLRREIEVTQILDLVAPEFGAHRFRHTERIDVEDAAADAELRHVFDHRDALESDAFEMRGKFGQPIRRALSQLDAKFLECARHPRLLEECAGRREQNAQVATGEALERFDTLARDFHMWFGLAESFACRIEGDRRIRHQRLEIREPSLGTANAVRDDDEEARWKSARERRNERNVGRARESADLQTRRRRGKRVENSRKCGKTLDRVKQCVERHQATRRLRAPMATASTISRRSAAISAGSTSERRAAARNAIEAHDDAFGATSVRSLLSRSASSAAE